MIINFPARRKIAQDINDKKNKNRVPAVLYKKRQNMCSHLTIFLFIRIAVSLYRQKPLLVNCKLWLRATRATLKRQELAELRP